MEQGEIKSLLETEKIDRVCRAHAQRHSILKVLLKKAKISLHLVRSPLVCTIIKVAVLTNKPTRQKGFCISMFVYHAGLKMVSLTHTQKTECRKSAKNE